MELLTKQPATQGPAEMFTGDRVIVVRPGDTVHTPPGEEHWQTHSPTTS